MSIIFEDDPEFNAAPPKPKSRRRFTFGGLLAVAAILVTLIALMLPAVRSARGPARQSQCINNLKQIALALYNYEHEYGALPPAYSVDAQGRPLHSWRTLILPFLEQGNPHPSIDLSKPWDDPVNLKAGSVAPYVFRCPESPLLQGRTTYLAIVTPNGCFLPDRPRRLAEITDDHHATLMVIETGEEHAVPWMAPLDAGESLVLSLGLTGKPPHPGGMEACRVDGSVTIVKPDTPARERRAMISISGNDDKAAEGP
jgi:hypothetical protein